MVSIPKKTFTGGHLKKSAEHLRLEEYRHRKVNWKNWGPYLCGRAWGTVREDYSEHGTSWDYFPHDHSHSRTYRWNEDGLSIMIIGGL
jgi:hypothetical protein